MSENEQLRELLGRFVALAENGWMLSADQLIVIEARALLAGDRASLKQILKRREQWAEVAAMIKGMGEEWREQYRKEQKQQ